MNIATLIKEALKSITSNKVRSFLTMLGIFIGVGAVIAMMSIGQGAQNSITNSLSSLGTQTLYLSPGNFTENVRNARDLRLHPGQPSDRPDQHPHPLHRPDHHRCRRRTAPELQLLDLPGGHDRSHHPDQHDQRAEARLITA